MDGGIHTSKPSGMPKTVNIAGLVSSFSKLAVGAVKGFGTAGHIGWGDIVGSIPEMIAALKNIGSVSNEERAYLLVNRALARAIAQLGVENQSLLAKTIARDNGLTQSEAEETGFVLAPDFLQHPREIDLLSTAKTVFAQWLYANGLTEIQAQMTAERLPSYFALGLHEELTDHQEFFEPLLKGRFSFR